MKNTYDKGVADAWKEMRRRVQKLRRVGGKYQDIDGLKLVESVAQRIYNSAIEDVLKVMR